MIKSQMENFHWEITFLINTILSWCVMSSALCAQVVKHTHRQFHFMLGIFWLLDINTATACWAEDISLLWHLCRISSHWQWEFWIQVHKVRSYTLSLLSPAFFVTFYLLILFLDFTWILRYFFLMQCENIKTSLHVYIFFFFFFTRVHLWDTGMLGMHELH